MTCWSSAAFICAASFSPGEAPKWWKHRRSSSPRTWGYDGDEIGEVWKCWIRKRLVERATGIELC